MKLYKITFIFLVIFLKKVYSSKEVRDSWVDIPILPYAVTNPAQEYDNLKKLINHYHDFDKSNIENLSSRIFFLQKINFEIKEINSNNKNLKSLAKIAKKKAWYLTQIASLYKESNGICSVSAFKHLEKKDYESLPLSNKLIYGFNYLRYWGLYWLEAIDPCHRFLTPYYVKWQQENSYIPFFLWLENQEVPCSIIQIKYLDEDSIANSYIYISVDDGLIYNANNKKANYLNNDKEYLYIITMNKKFLVIEGSEQIRHTSLTWGESVLGAGALKVQEGHLLYIDAESGHYQPNGFALLQSIKILQEFQIKFDYSSIQVKYYENSKLMKENLGFFLRKYSNLDNTKYKTKKNDIKFTY